MSYATLRFKIPDEKEEFEMACHAIDYKIAIDDFKEKLRGLLKYSNEPKIDDFTLEYIRDEFFSILTENNIQ